MVNQNGRKDLLDKYHMNKIGKILETGNYNIPNILYLNVVDDVLITNYIYRLTQIVDFKWISNVQYMAIIKRLQMEIFKEANGKSIFLEFEKKVEITDDVHTIVGFVDIIDHTSRVVYEIKFKREIAVEDIFQTYIYATALSITDVKYESYRYKLFNVRTDELYMVYPDVARGKKFINYMLQKENIGMNDEVFIKEMTKYKPIKKSNLDILNVDLYKLD